MTAFNTVTIFAAVRPAGVALWRLGTEDPSIWEFLGRDVRTGDEVARRLCRVEPQSVLYQGKGEALYVASRPAPGLRRLSW